MKKFYVLIVVILGFAGVGIAQNYYWIGPANGNWNSTANWSPTSGGSAGINYPHLSTDNVFFTSSATVSLNENVNVSTLLVTNSSTVRITSVGDFRTLTANSISTSTPALQIDAGSRLEDSTVAGTQFEFAFGNNAQGVINGQWYITGNSLDDGAFFTMPTATGQTTRLNVNNGGAIIVSPNGFLFPNDATDTYLVFNAGSTFEIQRDGTSIPKANYDPASTILINGCVNNGLAFNESVAIGNLTYNCPGQNGLISLALLNINLKGDLKIQNTNNQPLTIVGNGSSSNTTINVIVEKNLEISGNSSVVLSRVDLDNKTVTLTVQGNLIAGGTSFDLQTNSVTSPASTNLVVKGNLQHTAGTFGVSSSSVDENAHLFNIEFAGSAAQTVSSVTGSFDNTNHQVTLRMNNAAGLTLLSPLQVGRVSFNTTNKGNVNTSSGNELTVANATGNSIVINSPSSAGFIDGPFRRKTASTNALTFATGNGGVFRPVTIYPSDATPTTFEAAYFNTGNGAPLGATISGVANYQWEVNRIGSGAGATVELTLPGAISGANSNHTLFVVKYDDGGSWVSARGTTGTTLPGTATSGTLTSEVQNSFSMFTIGYALSSALPINLISFNGKKSGTASAVLNWKISGNSTPERFEVLRSAEGVNFTGIGSLAGATGKLDYTFTDNGLAAGNNYYRLKMIDKDGGISYSNIIVIMNGTNGIVIGQIMPSIVRDRARLNISSSLKGNMQLVITDISGRIIQNQSVSINPGSQEVWIDATRLRAGMFQVTGYINGEKTSTIRFIKQ